MAKTNIIFLSERSLFYLNRACRVAASSHSIRESERERERKWEMIKQLSWDWNRKIMARKSVARKTWTLDQMHETFETLCSKTCFSFFSSHARCRLLYHKVSPLKSTLPSVHGRPSSVARTHCRRRLPGVPVSNVTQWDLDAIRLKSPSVPGAYSIQQSPPAASMHAPAAGSIASRCSRLPAGAIVIAVINQVGSLAEAAPSCHRVAGRPTSSERWVDWTGEGEMTGVSFRDNDCKVRER